MNRIFVRAMALFSVIALSACSGGSLGRTLLPQTQNAQLGGATPEAISLVRPTRNDYPLVSPNAVGELCPSANLKPNQMRCYALVRNDLRGLAPDSAPYGFGAKDLQSAYNAPIGSKGGTVAIVDAYGYALAESDLKAYRKYFGLPPCTKANGCLKIVNQNGQTSPLPSENVGWAGEQALDLDMVSAMCPKCKIVLVQTNDDYRDTLYIGVKTAANMNANVVSNSYGGKESQASNSFPKGVTYVASTGDGGGGSYAKNGGGPQQPCTFQNVVCVGGTKLKQDSSTRGWSEIVWNDLKVTCNGGGNCGAANSGCSTWIARPAWQASGNPSCHGRAAADISAEAAVTAPVAVYYSGYLGSSSGPWLAFGGTSASAPMIAGMIALAGNGKTANVAQKIWQKAGTKALYDVTKGTNVVNSITGPCASSVTYICVARPGYDGPTGNGTPNGTAAL